ncbi:aldehyde dehydrogenase [Amycolatopsis sp. K13G38]|uniref:Aldehyde dehydrogenase n=1 Tax=Amycolatopsis acididurans TaxID=2724524 RepID=A0ABX1JBV8_9PSEU|nr:aldehyde dehydrogenase [Amycolatopsis acididurans]NKQ56726.1 aldehyde dehydrogenase [Amycolatopsis acididurans]
MTTVLDHLLVDGRPLAGAGDERITLVNPATEEVIGSVPVATAADVDAAVRSASATFRADRWRKLGPVDRAALLRRLAEIIESRAGELAALITRQNGMPVKMTRWGNAYGAAAAYRYYADLVDGTSEEDSRPGQAAHAVVRREPVGVVGIIAPWNGPQILVAWKLAPALAAGCTAVLKPAPETSLDAHWLAEAMLEAGFPPGVLNVVTGGRDTGMALVEHPLVSKVAFTGSSAAGREIAAACGSALKPVTLELGGKSAAILLEDADLDAFTGQVTRLCAPNSGQVCYSCTRILAPESRYDSVVDAVVGGMRSARMGDPSDRNTDFGPLVSARQRDRVEKYVEIGNREGAEIVLGGARPSAPSRGFYYAPTVFRGVHNRMKIAQEEIFGPVLVVIPYRDEDEAVEIANDSEYGLGGSVFTADPERGMRVARRVETGTIGINGYDLSMEAPFGGRKASGLGRELGPEGLAAYYTLKSIYNAPVAS